MRRIYAKFSHLQAGKGKGVLKPYHHIYIDQELRFNCLVWKLFLENFRQNAVCRPMTDFQQNTYSSTQLNFYSDASINFSLGFGDIFGNRWIFAQWERGYIQKFNLSIEYLELFALKAAILTWGEYLKDQ